MKQKTHKMTAKKIKLSKPKRKKTTKLMAKKAGQDHFNARESGKVGRAKRRKRRLPKALNKNIRSRLPYS
ncbi:MAG: 50S ribosomal protein L35 [Candidatus Buchananbacteria bacterium CG10_big_fil_rev_8_21_14_0_10_42_9]|uniref:50S ribosomal protein L35 n=1 Tax=Candidatus Buchananbacteria bacterium CG10_big_fil_rev_8_21_14_0_10_42_9 TaxID=1974526 RepID=A0A2H0W2M7_9BACT|nr:MAG: 50S ribosomal protein L35 [Candidatus Buchananbacteria bacterium CG10_big_fil_rev_8_21_14_0_10_42_9]